MVKYPVAFALSLVVAFSAVAQETVNLKYQFRPGRSVRYEAKQSMKIESTVSGTTQTFTQETVSNREWRVLSVDERGNARMSLVNERIQMDATTADGKKISFDTSKPNEAGPLAAVVGKPLVEVVLTPMGKVVDVQQSQNASAGQFAAHVRTLLYPLPSGAVAAGATWQNEVTLPLPPPVGKGEEVRLRQSFRLEKMVNGVAIINLQSAPAEEIKDRALHARIAQFLPSGQVEFDMSRGVVRSVDLKIDQKINEFAGPESTTHVTGSYREVLQEDVVGGGLR